MKAEAAECQEQEGEDHDRQGEPQLTSGGNGEDGQTERGADHRDHGANRSFPGQYKVSNCNGLLNDLCVNFNDFGHLAGNGTDQFTKFHCIPRRIIKPG